MTLYEIKALKNAKIISRQFTVQIVNLELNHPHIKKQHHLPKYLTVHPVNQ